MRRQRVLYVVGRFPELSETYVRTELHAVRDEFDVTVASRWGPIQAYDERIVPHAVVGDDVDAVSRAIEAFGADVVHVHLVTHTPVVAAACRRAGIGFTVRSHSCDTLGYLFRRTLAPHRRHRIRAIVAALNSDECLGVLTYPFLRPSFVRIGVREELLIDAPAVVDHAAFLDRNPNGNGVMNVGAALPKKDHLSYLDVAQSLPDLQFDLYPVATGRNEITDENERRGRPVRIMPVFQPEDMPAQYKAHAWLLYSASKRYGSVGWPLAVAEAQASGTVVCMPRIRPDIDDFVGGAGFVVESLADARDILRRPVPEDIRDAGFEVSARSDVHRHKHLVTDLWRAVAPLEARPARAPGVDVAPSAGG